MFKLPVDFTVGYNGPVKSFSSVAEIYDPRTNPYNVPLTNGTAYGRDYLTMLKHIFTRENVNNAADILFGRGHRLRTDECWTNILKPWIDTIPDDRLWALNFIYVHGPYTANSDIEISFFSPRYPNEQSGYLAVREAWFQTYHMTDYIDELTRAFNGQYDKLVQWFNTNSDQLMSWDTTFIHCPPLMAWGRAQMGASVYRRGSSRGKLKLAELTNFLRDNPETVIINGDEFGGDVFDPVLSIPISRTNRSELYSVKNYSFNPCKILKWPLVAAKEHNPVLYGVELEVATDHTIKELMDAGNEPFMIGKSDGSINGKGNLRVELVTVPMSLKRHKQEWAYWFSNLDYKKFDCTVRTNNGMHVHIDRTAFLNADHIQRFTWMLVNPCHYDFMSLISERHSSYSIQNYCPFPIFNNHSKLQAFKKCVEKANQIRGAVNFQKQATIEVRLFRGIVSYASILKNLEFVDALRLYTEERPFNELNLSSFFAWLDSLPLNRYKVLRKYLKCNNLDEILLTTSVRDITFGMNDPDRIAQKINASKLLRSGNPKIGTRIASILNKGKKRQYIYDKATNTLLTTAIDKGKVAFLDKTLEEQYMRSFKKQTAA